MRKEKRIKNKVNEKKTIYIIGAVLVCCLVAILGISIYTNFSSIEERNCARGMILMGEGMQAMAKEFRLDPPGNPSFEQLGEMIAYYFHYGPDAFDYSTTGTLVLKSENRRKGLPLVKRKSRYILDIPVCAAGGTYQLIPSKSHPGMYDMECSKHGRIYLPDQDGKYAFSGDLDVFQTRKTAFGLEANVYFQPEEAEKEFVTLIPHAEPGEPSVK